MIHRIKKINNANIMHGFHTCYAFLGFESSHEPHTKVPLIEGRIK
jgi:hypothetical protein